jgi:hypothetical protein
MTVHVYVNTSKQVGRRPHQGLCHRGRCGSLVCGERSRRRGLRISADWNFCRLKESEMGFRFSAPKPNRKKAAPASFQQLGPFLVPHTRMALLQTSLAMTQGSPPVRAAVAGCHVPVDRRQRMGDSRTRAERQFSA